MEHPKIFAPNEGQTLTIQQNSPRKSKPIMIPPKVPELPASSSNTSPKNLAKLANLPSSIEIKTLIDPKDWWDRPNKHSTVIYHWRSMTINGDLIATTISGQPSIQKIKCKDWIKVKYKGTFNFFRTFWAQANIILQSPRNCEHTLPCPKSNPFIKDELDTEPSDSDIK